MIFVALGGLIASVAAVAAVGANSASATPTPRAAAAGAEPVAGGPSTVADEASGVATEVQPPAFARIGELSLALPADELVVLGFHESATRETVALEPIGTVIDHQNTTKFDPPPADPDGTEYVVLSSRGRPMPSPMPPPTCGS